MFEIKEIRNRALTINQRKKISKFKDKETFGKAIDFFKDTYSIYVDNDIDNVRRIFTTPSETETCLLLFFLFFKKKLSVSDPLEFLNNANHEHRGRLNFNGKEEIILTTEEQRQWGTDIQDDFYWFMENIIENDSLDLFLVKAAKEYIDEANQKEYDEILAEYIGATMSVDDRFYDKIRSVIKRDFESNRYIEELFQVIWRAITTPRADMDYVKNLVDENFQRMSVINEMLKQDRDFAINSIYNVVESNQDRFDENDLKNVSGIINLYYVKKQHDILVKFQSELEGLRSDITNKIGDPEWIISVIG